ncbi:MAG: hypothetical protein JTT11_09100 [Candidatus Brockarchaeota archaeon]|nr:hypothetical protein [Candidatus Brockarchaeota archaeon]
MASSRSMKSGILKLLKEDEEFRYAVSGFIGLADTLKRFEEHDRKFNEIIARLDEHSKRFEEHDRKFNEILGEIRELKISVSNISAYIERVSLTIEEEAREVLTQRLRARGIELELSNLVLPDLEINVYGASGNLCLIGEVSTRAGIGIIGALNKKAAELSKKYPQYLKEKMVKAVYTMYATPDAVKEARANGVWLLKATEDLTQPPI